MDRALASRDWDAVRHLGAHRQRNAVAEQPCALLRQEDWESIEKAEAVRLMYTP